MLQSVFRENGASCCFLYRAIISIESFSSFVRKERKGSRQAAVVVNRWPVHNLKNSDCVHIIMTKSCLLSQYTRDEKTRFIFRNIDPSTWMKAHELSASRRAFFELSKDAIRSLSDFCDIKKTQAVIVYINLLKVIKASHDKFILKST